MRFGAIYARSSLGKIKQGDTVEHQIEMIKEFAKRTNIEVIFDDRFIYEDDGESGFKTTLLQRRAMRRLLNDIDNGLIDTVFFKGVSRYSRDSGEAITTAKRLINKGVRVISLEENYDSLKDDPTMFQIFAVMAENESRKTSIRVSLGNKQKARNGLWSGTIPPLGYVKIKDLKNEELQKTLYANGSHRHALYPDDHAHIVQKIFNWFVKEGWGRKKITSELNNLGYKTNRGRQFQEKTVLDILRNEVYIGNIVYGKTRYNYVEDEEKNKKVQKVVHVDEKDWVRVENAHLPIVKKELFDKAQELLNEKSTKFNFRRRFNAAKHPLTGLLRCGKCDAPMICQKRTNTKKDGAKLEYRYYVCSTYHKFGRNVCDQANVPADKLEEFLYNYIKVEIEKALSEWNENEIKNKNDNKKDILIEIRQLEQILSKKMNASKTLLETRPHYDLETFIELNKELQEEIKTVREQKEKLEKMLQEDGDENKLDLMALKEQLSEKMSSDLSKRRKIFHAAIQVVEVIDKEVSNIEHYVYS